MAIAYGKIIVNVFEEYYDDLLSEISSNYSLFISDKRVNVLTPSGDTVIIESSEMKKILIESKIVNFKIVNNFQNQITVSIELIDNYLINENYSMDELLNDGEEDDLLCFLKRRFDRLLDNRKAIGFIFDKQGYSEDYILIPPHNWRDAHDCWRKLMGG